MQKKHMRLHERFTSPPRVGLAYDTQQKVIGSQLSVRDTRHVTDVSCLNSSEISEKGIVEKLKNIEVNR